MPKTRADVLEDRGDQARRIGLLLAKARVAAGLTQVEAAKALGVPQSRIAKLELGQRQLRFLEALSLARLYGATADAFDPSTHLPHRAESTTTA